MGSVGKDIAHDSAVGHVSGRSVYIDDMPFAANELIVDFYASPVANGKVVSIDLTRAASVPGIVGLYTHKDIDGHNKFGPIIADEYLLAEDKVEFIGQPIVVIAGETRKAVKEARKLVDVKIDVLEPTLTVDQAIARKLYLAEPRFIKRGDCDAGFAQADHVLEGRFINGGQDHFYLEGQAAIAYPGEYDNIVVHSSTQHPSEVQEVIAHVLGLQQNQVVCITKRMGGGFGGKECQATHPACMASLVAQKTKRPARIVYNKDDDMSFTGGRHPFQNDYKVGFTKDGLITALKVDFYANGGAANDLSTAVLGRAMTHADNAYFIPNAHINGYVCKTNLPPNTAFRGFGGPQGIVNIENIMEEIAIYLDKDPFEIRSMNCYGIEDRNTTPYGQIVYNNLLPALLSRVAETSDYKKRLEAVNKFNQTSKTHLKGISVTPVKFGISFTTKFLNQANAMVLIYKDGTVLVSTGATEMGQGVNTKIRQLVADEFAIDPSMVLMAATATDKNNNTSATAASAASDLNGSAAVDACTKLRTRLAECAANYLSSDGAGISPSPSHIVFAEGNVFDKRRPDKKMTFAEIVSAAYHERINLGERGFYATPGIDFNWKTGVGQPFLYYTQGAACSEVLIDRFTGELKVTRADLWMDIGKSINPGIDRGQITGAYIQGMGWVTTEELRRSEDGVLLSHSPTTYKIPNVQDMPAVFNIDLFENEKNDVNIRGSKAVGEPPFLLAISVWTAVKQALASVSKEAASKLKLPATNEEIVMCMVTSKKSAVVSKQTN